MVPLKELKPGMRVELHPGTDEWMRGDRYGEVVERGTKTAVIKLDKSGRNLRCRPENLQRIVT